MLLGNRRADDSTVGPCEPPPNHWSAAPLLLHGMLRAGIVKGQGMGIGIICGLLAGALWGMVFIAPRLLPAFTPWELSIGRYLAYGLVALVASLPLLRRISRKLTRADCLALLRQSCAGNLVYYVLLAAAVQLAGVGPASLIIGILPISVSLAGRRDRGALPLRQLALPLLLVALGIACINIDLFSSATASQATVATRLAGVACAAGALASWTWYAVDNARYLQRNPQYSSHEWSALYGLSTGVLSVVFGILGWLLFAPLVTAAETQRDWQMFWLVNGALALGASLIGNSLWNRASRRLPLTLSGQLLVMESLFALLYVFMLEGRLPRLLEATAIALLIVGVAWAVRLHGTLHSRGKSA